MRNYIYKIINQNTITIVIISYFNTLLEQLIVLAAFIPVIIGIGGNVGTQSSTIVVRGLATGRVDVSNTFSLIVKEILVGALLGGLYGLIVGAASELITGAPMKDLGLASNKHFVFVSMNMVITIRMTHVFTHYILV